jgi:hypothetical protein
MKKIFLTVLSSLFVLIGCGQEEANVVETKKVEVKQELVNFINSEVVQADQEQLYFKALSYLYAWDKQIVKFQKSKDKVAFINSLPAKNLNDLWDSVYLNYKINNYSYFYYRDISPTSLDVLMPGSENRVDSLIKSSMKDLMMIHNAIYSKSNGKEKKLGAEFLDLDDSSINKMLNNHRAVVLTQNDLLLNAETAFTIIVEQYGHNIPRIEVDLMGEEYGSEITDFLYSRVGYDIAKLQYESLDENAEPKLSDIYYDSYKFHKYVSSHYGMPSFGEYALESRK